MTRPRIPLVVLVAAAAIVALLVYGVVQKQGGKGSDALDKRIAQGERPPAPEAELARPLVAGAGTGKLADLRGKVVVLNFYASWCEPCKDEAPVLQRTQQQLASDGSGTVLAIAYQDPPAASADFLKTEGLTFPGWRDPGDKLFDAYGNSGIPETFVLDPRGRIVSISRGQVDRAFLDRAVAQAKAAA